LPPIDQDRDHDAEVTEQPGQLEDPPEAPDAAEQESAYLTPPQPSDETASHPAPPLVAREPEVAPPDEPTLLDQIPVVQASQPQPAIPPPIPPVLRRIEPDYIPRAEGRVQPSPAVVPPAEPEIIAPSSPPVALPLPSHAAGRTLGRRLRLALVAALAISVALASVVLALAALYRWVDPPMSTLMLGQRLAGTPVTQRWVPLERMSPNLSAAVIQSEDGHFCRHHGVDWGELKEAIDSASDGLARGGSTITMQVVKNLFLWPSRSYLRKALEIPLAFVVEALWPKRRILEIYLNIAEWGPGVFGAEAAARYHFRKPALLLTPREAALLAVSLPNPFERQAGRPGPGTQRLADNLLLRMRAASANTACVRAAAKRY
jgi:monofunctional biosynthetic peptidoglycan transglycosylase